LRVVLDGNLRGHAAHRVNAAPMAGLDQQLDVDFEKVPRHGDLRAIRQHELRIVPEFLDEAEM